MCGQNPLLGHRDSTIASINGPFEALELLRRGCQAAEKLEASAGFFEILASIRYRTQLERFFHFHFSFLAC
jgi:hypothetical protein